MIDTMIARLTDVTEQKYMTLKNVTIQAAKAALIVAEKYRKLSADCELYDISIGMSMSVNLNLVHCSMVVGYIQSCVLIRRLPISLPPEHHKSNRHFMHDVLHASKIHS